MNTKPLDFKYYLVGGAVRDKLLKLDVKDRDWVVVGETITAMQNRGFSPVGKTFPVFLHPDTKEEYALARKETKTGEGYNGFDCIADPTISLEEDLLRRDLTINAIAENSDGTYIDPFNGLADLDNKLLRHVSLAFTEDPLRVLRVARFHARFYALGFSVATETLALMQTISLQGELKTLSAERIWQETEKALLTENPEQFFLTLKACGALEILFPEIYNLYGIPQRAEHHPEIDCGIHTMLSLEQAVKLTSDLSHNEKVIVRFATLTHDLGKAITPSAVLPSHRGHEQAGIPLVNHFCKRLKTPKQVQTLALLNCEFHLLAHTAAQLKPATVLKLLKRLDAFRKPEQLTYFLLCSKADSRGRTGFENRHYLQAHYLLACFEACKNVSVKDINPNKNIQGKAIGEELDRIKTHAIKQCKNKFNFHPYE